MTKLQTARILACIPIPPIFTASPFILQGPTSWLGWLQIIALVTLIVALGVGGWVFRLTDIVLLFILYVYGIVVAFTTNYVYSPASKASAASATELPLPEGFAPEGPFGT